MGAEIISIILKSVLSGKSINKLIGGIKDAVIDEISETSMKHIEDLVDKSRDKFKDVLSEKNLVELNISNTDYVIAEIKDILVHVKIDNELLERCQYNVEELKDFLWEYYAVRHDNIEMGRDIKKAIDAVSNVLMDMFYKSEEFVSTLMIAVSKNVNSGNRKLKEISDKQDEIYKAIITPNGVQSEQGNTEQKPYNRANEYAAVWDENMFLNNFDKRDKNAGTNVKLSEVYLEEHLPNYSWMNNDELEPRSDLKELLLEHINDKVGNKMLLILGQPGIGKSTLITWIMANFKVQKDNILIYKFSSDLNDIDWNESDVFVRILEKLGLSYGELNNKTLILDGFDEINAGDNRREVLDSLYWNLIKGNRLERFSLIITCRENYIQTYERIQCSYIRLQPWNALQIESFCEIYGKKTKMDISKGTIENIIRNKTILGIPLILYMVLALDISIEDNHSMVDVYDKVFALEGGIYDRCIDNKEFAEPHRIKKIKRQIHQISKEMAIHIFENNPDEELITQKEYYKICNSVIQEQVQKEDVLIGNYFMKVKHCENTEIDKLSFIHRSIYEYFVGETIYCSLRDVFASSLEDEQEVFIKNLVQYFKTGQISVTIGEFLQYKILKLYNCMEDDKKKEFWKWLENVVGKMMKKGMLNYVENDMKRFDYVMEHEAICFRNVMYLMSLLSELYPTREYILSTIEEKVKQFYLQLFSTVSQFPNSYNKKKIYNLIMRKSDLWGFNLEALVLEKADFKYSKFINQNMKKAILKYVDFECAKLKGIDLSGADLEHAKLKDSDLRGAHLEDTNLKSADMRGTDIRDADMRRANLEDVHFINVKIDGSLWSKSDLHRMIKHLKSTHFEFIKVEDESGTVSKITKDDISRVVYSWNKLSYYRNDKK